MDFRNRKKIGILFNFSGSWLGGVYYVQNIIKALNFLEDVEKPEIVVFYTNELANFAKEIQYPYIKLVQNDFSNPYSGYLKSWFFRKNIFITDIIQKYNLDGVYPLYDHPLIDKKLKGKTIAAWFPDLQHKFYPKYFNKINLLFREARVKLILKNASVLVVSSNDVANHFKQFYKIPKALKIHVLPFVSIIDDFNFNNFLELKEKYSLPDEYFMVSNQFYEHKNHIIIMKALSVLKKNNSNIKIVLTGKMEDYRNPNYIEILKNEIIENKIEGNAILLGVIPRKDQLCLIKNAKAIIQPSLFEGWSTVIEDAKSLQVPVIASEIAVHKEQLEENGTYFDPKNADELATILEKYNSGNQDLIFEEYQERVKKCAANFMSVFN
ncbi:glycosyltransferase family 1 protein [Flavobacterium sp. LC2016-12]|uniref:glycosyltransferase family 4 protein n=1 Tax=Flavobacterium sp. LC2016-12 TaxID=2783794 RepID=UPI00188B4EB8|nr:glycosyltransferase family 1 protein [Flavobacterium sp. LC2016-12]MBF4465671.1 glycosyltransferase family 4 protein [Flavobacterium sp. LC2016-12]